MEAFVAKLADKKGSEEGLNGLSAILASGNKETYIMMSMHLPAILELVADKQKPVATAAESLVKAIFAKAECWDAAAILRSLEKALDGKAKPPTKECALQIVLDFSKKYPRSLAREIEWIIQPIVMLMNDVKASVKSKAKEALEVIKTHLCLL